MRFPRIIFVLLAFCLLLVACGDDGSSSATATTSAPVDESAPPSTADAGTDDGDMDDGDMDDDMDEGGDAALVGPYCALSAQAESRSAAFEGATATPEVVEEFYRSMLALTEQGLETAPAAVADALAVQRDVLVETIDLLSASGWDLLGSFEGLSAIYEDPEFLAVGDLLDEFDADVCGFAPDENPPDEVPPVVEPVDVPVEFEAYCAASFEASETDDLPFDADATAVEAYYRGLLVNLDALEELGPPQLADDLETIRANFLEVVAILEGADWDLDVGFPMVQEWASDPEVTDPMDAAIDRVEAFDADVCGIVY